SRFPTSFPTATRSMPNLQLPHSGSSGGREVLFAALHRRGAVVVSASEVEAAPSRRGRAGGGAVRADAAAPDPDGSEGAVDALLDLELQPGGSGRRGRDHAVDADDFPPVIERVVMREPARSKSAVPVTALEIEADSSRSGARNRRRGEHRHDEDR